MNPISPCIYPKCDRDNGNPELTKLGACEPCQRRYQHCLQDLVNAWTILRTTFPQPTKSNTQIRHNKKTSFGHPAEWASDTASEIASKLNWTHDALADHLNGPPPPHEHAREATRIRAAWKYLQPRIQQLCLMPGAKDAAEELAELRGKTKTMLGQTRARTWLKGVPCMACNTTTLVLIDDDHVECDACQWRSSRAQFGLLARHAVDTMLDEYAATHGLTVA